MRLYSECIGNYPQDFITVVEALAIQNASMYLALKEDKNSLEEDIWSHRLYFYQKFGRNTMKSKKGAMLWKSYKHSS